MMRFLRLFYQCYGSLPLMKRHIYGCRIHTGGVVVGDAALHHVERGALELAAESLPAVHDDGDGSAEVHELVVEIYLQLAMRGRGVGAVVLHGHAPCGVGLGHCVGHLAGLEVYAVAGDGHLVVGAVGRTLHDAQVVETLAVDSVGGEVFP